MNYLRSFLVVISFTLCTSLGLSQEQWIEPGPKRLDSQEFSRLHGGGLIPFDYIGNLPIGDNKNYLVSQRFRATCSSSLSAIKPYWIASAPDYSKGTGGRILIRVLPDIDGKPDLTASPLAVGEFLPGLVEGNFPVGKPHKEAMHNTTKLTETIPLERGTLYHVVYENLDANPTENFIGLNNSATDIARGDIREWISGDDWGVLLGIPNDQNEIPWTEATNRIYNGRLRYMPILGIYYADEHATAQGYSLRISGNWKERDKLFPDRIFELTNLKPMREAITPSKDISFLGFYIYTASLRPSVLSWTLTDQHGNSIGSGSLSQPVADFELCKVFDGFIGKYSAKAVRFPSPIDFKKGETYYLTLTPQGESRWAIAVQADGREAAYGFMFPVAKTEFTAQHYANGKWIYSGPSTDVRSRNGDHYSSSLPTVWIECAPDTTDTEQGVTRGSEKPR